MTDTSEQVELKPCPFCGSEAAFGHIRYSRPVPDANWSDGSDITEAHYVNCVRCCAKIGSFVSGGFQTKAQASTKWNTRAALASLPRTVSEDRIEALKIAGGSLANCAFNMSQRSHLTDAERRSLKLGQEQWDNALAALTPKSVDTASAEGWVRQVVAFLKQEANYARSAQGSAKSDTDKLYRMGQKDGLLLVAEAIERGAIPLASTPSSDRSVGDDVLRAALEKIAGYQPGSSEASQRVIVQIAKEALAQGGQSC